MYETIIGLEVHLQLSTRTKAFCGCSTEFGNRENTQVCPVCLGFPGSLPVLNKSALDFAIKVALALNCQIQQYTKFDRKHYFYPDLPKNYQISQYDLPLSRDGFLDIISENTPKRIRIRRIHLEEDAGKLLHRENLSLVDFNRTGIPLLEIVSEPDINSPQEAYEYLSSLKSIIEYLDVSDCDMEKGSLRCDVNISLRKQGQKELGVKIEIKNLNSFKGVKDALAFEIKRQTELLDAKEKLIQETRLYDARDSKTLPMRTKEEAQDYRYFPDPDLPIFVIENDKIEEIGQAIPELPKQRAQRFKEKYGLSEYESKILVSSKKESVFFEELIKSYPGLDKRPLVNWLLGPLFSVSGEIGCMPSGLNIPGGKEELFGLIKLVEEDRISNLMAKTVFNQSIKTGVLASEIIKDKNLFQVSDSESLEGEVDLVLKDNPKSVSDFKSGKSNALMFLVGQVMKRTEGKANPKMVQDILKRRVSDA